MLVLTWNLFHGRSVPDAPRALLADFAAQLAAWEWDVALLQEVPPWWPPALGPRVRGERAHRADLAQLAAALSPLGRAAPPRPHQVVGRRRQRDPRARRGDRRAPRARRCARGPSGAWCTACAWSAAGGSATCTPQAHSEARAQADVGARGGRPRSPGRPARPSSSAATSTRAGPLAPGFEPVAGHSVDHVLARRLRAGEPGRTLERGSALGPRARCWRRLPRKDRREEAS